ncbi:hypothetical protein ACFW4K_24550 [Nocardiopsis alba]|uniref:hypothetical protein n=1 Tax=Nocardiopsis alba TaxID=53437 RepID=UPI003672F1C2
MTLSPLQLPESLMGYTLEAVVARSTLLREAATALPGAHQLELSQGLALMPVNDALRDHGPTEGKRPLSDVFSFMSGRLERWIVDRSTLGPIAYLEADYFGGTGTQSSAVWEHGTLALGPLTVGEWERHPEEGGPISRALRHLGVRVGPEDIDEFEAVGLNAHRSTESWVRARNG